MKQDSDIYERPTIVDKDPIFQRNTVKVFPRYTSSVDIKWKCIICGKNYSGKCAACIESTKPYIEDRTEIIPPEPSEEFLKRKKRELKDKKIKDYVKIVLLFSFSFILILGSLFYFGQSK